jgi:hypothetical protein
MPFSIVNVSTWSAYRDEQMGSKTKLWVLDEQNRRWLFKERRHQHGEDWSEKLAAEIAETLGIRHAAVEIAARNQVAGSISLDFLGSRSSIQLMHGNELLVQLDSSYPAKGANFRISQHTVDKALSVLRQDFISLGVNPQRPAGITSPVAEFVGYLMLDALIGNTDRHHENWAIVVQQTGPQQTAIAELAPTFDHASSLGRELGDDDRARRLSGQKAAPTFESYWRKMPSRWYRDPGNKRPLHPMAAFRVAAARFPQPAEIWQRQLELLTDPVISSLTDSLPPPVCSDPARQFAARMLRFGKEQLLNPKSFT